MFMHYGMYLENHLGIAGLRTAFNLHAAAGDLVNTK